jgi:formate/nitrite transporter
LHARAALCFIGTAAAASLQARPALGSALELRGGAFPAPKPGYHALAAKGKAVSSQACLPNLLSGAHAGAYVAFGGILAITIASALGDVAPGVQKLVFGALFPLALMLVVCTGSQLFTGNTASVAAALYEGLIDVNQLIQNWSVTWIGNMVGSLAFCEMIKYSGLLTGTTAKMAANIAVAKTKGAFGPTVMKAILANWLVCIAAFMSGSESDLAGKLLGAWFPISAFVMIGLEHSVANFFLIPLGIAAGADVSWADAFVKNFLPGKNKRRARRRTRAAQQTSHAGITLRERGPIPR